MDTKKWDYHEHSGYSGAKPLNESLDALVSGFNGDDFMWYIDNRGSVMHSVFLTKEQNVMKPYVNSGNTSDDFSDPTLGTIGPKDAILWFAADNIANQVKDLTDSQLCFTANIYLTL